MLVSTAKVLSFMFLFGRIILDITKWALIKQRNSNHHYWSINILDLINSTDVFLIGPWVFTMYQ